MTKPISAVIVEDEPLGRDLIRALLRNDSEVNVVGESDNGRDALKVIEKTEPDLVFLDVRMPEIDGFEVLAGLRRHHAPVVVFVTAYDEYAVRAFEVNAVDYLLKPFDRDRFHQALDRAKTQIRFIGGDAHTRHYPERLLVKSGSRIVFVRTDEVDWIEAQGNYVRLHVKKETHLLRTTIRNLEDHLDPSRFARIHRSQIVNIDRIRELRPWWHGEYQVLLKDGTQLTLSRTYRERIQHLMLDI
jgi:two-component system LytT family response regulator